MASILNVENTNDNTKIVESFLREEELDDILILTIDRITATLEIAVPFKNYLLKLMKDGKQKIIINLTNVEYIDSTFLGTLVYILKKINHLDGKMKLIISYNTRLFGMFDITNMVKIFDVYNNLDGAKISFNISSKMKELIRQIAYCENIEKTSTNCGETDCKKILTSQKSENNNYQLPQPWNGDIETSKILFISFNQSLNLDDYYPDNSWKKNDVYDFFVNRFSEKFIWVKNQLYPLEKNKQYRDSKHWIRYWAGVRNYAKFIFQFTPEPGIDYSLTEIVHCKSEGGNGVNEAALECYNKHFDKILNLTSAKILIVVGKKTEEKIKSIYNFNSKVKLQIQMINDIERIWVFIPHPYARGKKNLGDIFTKKELSTIRNYL